jgi:hypothetical protein
LHFGCKVVCIYTSAPAIWSKQKFSLMTNNWILYYELQNSCPWDSRNELPVLGKQDSSFTNSTYQDT